MSREALAGRVEGAEDPEAPLIEFGGGPPAGPPGPPVSNARLALLAFIAAELMLFAGLIGAFMVLRFGAPVWPPPGQPRLPVAVTAGNTAALLLSAVTMRRGWTGIRAGDRERLRRAVLATAILGTLFLAVQGSEWVRLVRHGLSWSNAYGSTFAALIGLHGLHVLGALLWLLVVLGRAGSWRYSARRHLGVELCAIYWTFVCGLWVVLFGLVYLT